jgi:hypothetical protein
MFSRLNFLGLILMGIFVAGCASPGSYRQLPASYTALPSPAGTECYLVSIVQAFGEPLARRFDFVRRDDVTTVEIHRFTMAGPQLIIRKEGAEASRLLERFRRFDWNAVEPSPPDRGTTLYLDDPALTLKARTARSYREAHGGLSGCTVLRELFNDVME